jgi:hypothetical protein
MKKYVVELLIFFLFSVIFFGVLSFLKAEWKVSNTEPLVIIIFFSGKCRIYIPCDIHIRSHYEDNS